MSTDSRHDPHSFLPKDLPPRPEPRHGIVHHFIIYFTPKAHKERKEQRAIKKLEQGKATGDEVVMSALAAGRGVVLAMIIGTERR